MNKKTRGVRNNNPGNVRKNGQKWQGMRPYQYDVKFIQFKEMVWGVRALLVTLRTYITRRGCTTVPKIINRWAPKTDGNNTDFYIKACALAVGMAVTNSTDLNEQVAAGMNYEFSRKDFDIFDENYEKLTLYQLASSMCWIESNYDLCYSMFYNAIKKM
ncbi:MAG: hypothetical protein II706_08125 [Bacteroidaceae bacterium]|nr:hypothetical protein [Bacteroidaceae bacterium]